MLNSPIQIRAARALLGWNQLELSAKSGVAIATIRRQESAEEFSCTVAIMHKLQRTLEGAGIEFLNHGRPGVRLTKS